MIPVVNRRSFHEIIGFFAVNMVIIEFVSNFDIRKAAMAIAIDESQEISFSIFAVKLAASFNGFAFEKNLAIIAIIAAVLRGFVVVFAGEVVTEINANNIVNLAMAIGENFKVNSLAFIVDKRRPDSAILNVIHRTYPPYRRLRNQMLR